MTIEMEILYRDSGEYEVVPVATSEAFRRDWLSACERLDLESISVFGGRRCGSSWKGSLRGGRVNSSCTRSLCPRRACHIPNRLR